MLHEHVFVEPTCGHARLASGIDLRHGLRLDVSRNGVRDLPDLPVVFPHEARDFLAGFEGLALFEQGDDGEREAEVLFAPVHEVRQELSELIFQHALERELQDAFRHERRSDLLAVMPQDDFLVFLHRLAKFFRIEDFLKHLEGDVLLAGGIDSTLVLLHVRRRERVGVEHRHEGDDADELLALRIEFPELHFVETRHQAMTALLEGGGERGLGEEGGEGEVEGVHGASFILRNG